VIVHSATATAEVDGVRHLRHAQAESGPVHIYEDVVIADAPARSPPRTRQELVEWCLDAAQALVGGVDGARAVIQVTVEGVGE